MEKNKPVANAFNGAATTHNTAKAEVSSSTSSAKAELVKLTSKTTAARPTVVESSAEGEVVNSGSKPKAESHKDQVSALPEDAPTPVPKQTVCSSQMVATGLLRVHEENANIYGVDESVEDLVGSIKSSGILDPLLVTKDHRIISGHRRFRAAQKLGIVEVPVRIFESDDEWEILNALLAHNRHRQKTNVQMAREAGALLVLETEYAARRQKAGGKEGVVENFPQGAEGKARDIVGKKVGLSGRSVGKAVKVLEASKGLRNDGNEADATDLEVALNKSIDSSYLKAVEMGLIIKAEPKPKRSAAEPKEEVTDAAVTETDEMDEEEDEVGEQPDEEPIDKDQPATEPVLAASDKPPLDAETAALAAERVLLFLRDIRAKKMTPAQKENWVRIFCAFKNCRENLGI